MMDLAGEHWSLLQAVAWILTRDHRIVRRCSLDAEEARAAAAEIQHALVPSGLKAGLTVSVFDECFGPVASTGGAREISVATCAAATRGRAFPEIDPADLTDHAKGLLVRALRRGDIRATAKVEDRSARVGLDTGEWTDGGIVVEDQRGSDLLRLGRPSQTGFGLRVDRSRAELLVAAQSIIDCWPESGASDSHTPGEAPRGLHSKPVTFDAGAESVRTTSLPPLEPLEASGGHVAPDRAGRQIERTDYRIADEPFVREGVEGIRSGRFRNANDAALEIADRPEVPGKGQVSSKVARLRTRIVEAMKS